MSRRRFVALTTTGIGAATGVALGGAAAAPDESKSESDPPEKKRPLLFVSTWPFGKPANERALNVFVEKGGSILDAVEQGIRLTEADAGNASVGLGGIPNADGVVQLDACIMNGPGHQAGSVGCIEGILHPITAARRVMEKTPHVMLVGEGAKKFALQQGLEPAELLTKARLKAWRAWRKQQDQKSKVSRSPENHDTISLLGLAPDGTIAGGCSTSGWGYKLSGRVGDSPIIGSGLYVDNAVGAAGATGLGENVMRYCASFMVVENMRHGMTPEEACVETIKRIARMDPKKVEDLHINFVALDKTGRFGAAGTGNGFQYAVTTVDSSSVLRSAALSAKDVGPEGGNVREK